ncbi:MAG: RusA family crossover junction endodeoxyribonuclease [Chlamydiae bacterium]|nr:RusA family crossover junction endodeoxyribonuclease [Chlamydiota bacterium]
MERIEIEGRPIAWQRVGVNRGRFFDRQSKERESFKWKLKKSFTKQPIETPIALGCIFSFAVPKTASKSKRMALLGTFYEGRSDVDNLVKWIGDVGQGILWQDDKQIVKLINVEKVWAEQDKTTIFFEEIK